MNLNELTHYLNEYLKVSEFEDTSLNGLQVQGKNDVKKAVFAVDASLETFKKAKELKADIVIVHHGLLWGKLESITGLFHERIKYLINNEISLYAAHLPLDVHIEVGNNIQLAKLIGLEKISEFGDYHGKNIGYKGILNNETEFECIVDKIEKKLKTKTVNFQFTNKQIKHIGIVSGEAGSIINEAVVQNLDLFITGERYHSGYHLAKEGNVNLIFAGHYATETLGIKALCNHISNKFDIETFFVDIPTNM